MANIKSQLSHTIMNQQMETSHNLFSKDNKINSIKDIQQLGNLINQKNILKSTYKNQGSYQVILQQSLVTQDKQFLYQILTENDPLIIRSSLEKLTPKKVIQLLKMIRSLLEQHIQLGKGQDHCLDITLWLEYLIQIHLTTIVSNPQNKQCISFIRKFIQKKHKQKTNVKRIKSHLLSQQHAIQLQGINQTAVKSQKIPKFQYIEQQKQNIQIQESHDQIDIEIQDSDMQGLEIDDFDINELQNDI